MKRLKIVWPLLFLVLSAGCALFTTVTTQKLQAEIPKGVLAVLDKGSNKEHTEQNFLIIKNEDNSPLYKNEASEKIRREYNITVIADDLTELDPIKSLLSRGWQLCLAGIYFLAMLWIWKAAIGHIVRGYMEYKSQKISKTAARLCAGVFLYLASVGIWYLLICYIDIPQQYLPIAGIWDVGYILNEIQNFHEKVQKFGNQIPVLKDIWRAGKTALIGYGSSILLFLPGWVGMFCRKN